MWVGTLLARALNVGWAVPTESSELLEPGAVGQPGQGDHMSLDCIGGRLLIRRGRTQNENHMRGPVRGALSPASRGVSLLAAAELPPGNARPTGTGTGTATTLWLVRCAPLAPWCKRFPRAKERPSRELSLLHRSLRHTVDSVMRSAILKALT